MSSEHKLLSACLKSRQAWSVLQNANIIDPKDLSPEGGIIFHLLNGFYDADPGANSCDIDLLCQRASREISSNKSASLISTELKRLASLDVSSLNIAQEALALKKYQIGLKLATLLSSSKHDSSASSSISELMSAYNSIGTESEEVEDEIYQSQSASELVKKSFCKDGLVQLLPRVLNDHVDGGLRGGHHVLVFAPTEMGKTLFVINAVYGFLRQGLRVLYVGNEDPATDIIMRLMTRLTGLNKYEILKNPEHADSILSKRNWDLFTFANLAPGTFPRICRLVSKYKSQVVVLDQLRNINVETENRTQALEKAATEARNLAKRYNIPVISVTQAADSASGKKILTRGDVDGSNVGIPGQVDLMIGLGADEVMEASGNRMLSFPKNKLSGRHEPLSIQIDPILSKVLE